MGWLIALAVFAVLAPLMAWLGRRHGRQVRGTAGLALVLLGFGQTADPPKRHLIEAMEGEEEAPAATGEPKDATSGS